MPVFAMRDGNYEYSAQKGKEVLLGCLPYALVERAPKASEQKGILYLDVRMLWLYLCHVWECKAKILFS